MKRSKRNHQPCRRCGKPHTNPRSSSICHACGIIEAQENRERARCDHVYHLIGAQVIEIYRCSKCGQEDFT